MKKEIRNYDKAVEDIKTAILQSQYEAAQSVNEKQLMLYYSIGKYISMNSRAGFWGKGAIDAISEKLSRELPGLRGFTARNLRYMRTFYEEWKILDFENAGNISGTDDSNDVEFMNSEMAARSGFVIWNLQVPKLEGFPIEAFLHIGFTHHRVILGKTKVLSERLFYIERCAREHYTVENLSASIARGDYHHQGSLPNNFMQTIPAAEQAFRAINTFKDEYLLDYINVEELGVRDKQDYAKPMGAATYKTSKDMSDELRKALPDVESLRRLLDGQEESSHIADDESNRKDRPQTRKG